MGAVQRIDGFQRRHAWAGFPLAAVYKFYDDQGGYLAALITYYGFLSVFPLLLLLVSVLGFVLHDNQHLQEQVLHSALRQFPVIGDQLGQNIRSFHGNSFAVGVGVVASLYGTLGVAQAAQNALNKVWAVPRHARPDPFRSRLRSLSALALFGFGLIGTTALTALATDTSTFGSRLGLGLRVVVTVLSFGVNAVLLLLAYRVLTDRRVPSRAVARSAVESAMLWQGVQWTGTYYVRHQLRDASATYGLFGIVLGLITWIYLGALIFVFTAEVTSVRIGRLWPRSLLTPFTDNVRLSAADRRAYTSYATTETFKGFERIQVDFHQPDTEPAGPETGPETGPEDRRGNRLGKRPESGEGADGGPPRPVPR